MAEAFESIPLETAIPALGLDVHFEGRTTLRPFLRSRDRPPGAPVPPPLAVRHYPPGAIVRGDIDMDAILYGEHIAGIVAEGDLRIDGSILNWEIDTPAAFLWVRGSLDCKNIVFGSMDLVVSRDVIASGLIVATYNHGHLRIVGDVRADRVIIDDDGPSVIEGRVMAKGWCSSHNARVALRKSEWLDEIRPECRDEFFATDGDMRCDNGNVDLVKALLAGRDILREERAPKPNADGAKARATTAKVIPLKGRKTRKRR